MFPTPATVPALAADFPGARGYLDSSSLGLPPAVAAGALRAAIAEWQAGHARPAQYDEDVRRSREAFARLAGVPPTDVAVAGQVSTFVGLVAAALPRGAQVIACEGEFTSVLFPFLARPDLEVRLVALDDLADAVDARTALIAYSAVQSADGALAAGPAIAAAARHHGARVLVDATQSAGWLPIASGDADFLVCGAYKWLLSPRGTAFLVVGAEAAADLHPAHAGWYAADAPWDGIYGGPLRLAADARRFDLSPAWLTWVGTAPALELLEEVGIDAIHAHDVRLAREVRTALGLAETGSAIVSLAAPDAALARLQAAGVRFSMRDGRARLAFHLYNDDADAECVIDALAT